LGEGGGEGEPLPFGVPYKLSRGEICVAIFIPPANVSSLGRYLILSLKITVKPKN
jgi:hypothetical protein